MKPCWTLGPKLTYPVGAGFLGGWEGLKMLMGEEKPLPTAACSSDSQVTVREEEILTYQEPCYASQRAHLIPSTMTAGLLLVTALLAREKGSKETDSQ